MLKIGDFARAARISIKALRHYDAIGLLRPAHVDRSTGYRYYAAAQLGDAERLVIYRNLGFSLDQTRALLDESCPPARLRALLEVRETELARRIELENTQLAEVRKRIRQIERGQRYPVVIRATESCEVISARRILPDYDALEPMLTSMRRTIPNSEIQGHGAIWHRCASTGLSIDCEALLFVSHPLASSRQLAGSMVASATHPSFDDEAFPHVYRAVLESIDAGHFQVAGPPREIYHPDFTEVQFPIRPWNGDPHAL